MPVMSEAERVKYSATTDSGKSWFRAGLVVLLLVLVVGVATVADYGMSWDEPFRFKGGDEKLTYYKQLLSGEEVVPLADTYPGLFDLPLALAHEWFPELGTRSQKGHFLSFLFGVIGLLAGWRLTARIGGERAGFWALLFLVALPRYYGHMFMNPKDVPFAATYLLGLAALVNVLRALPRPSWRKVLMLGGAAGLALSTRIGGGLILFYFALFVGVHLMLTYQARLRAQEPGWHRALGADVAYWAVRGLGAGVVAFLLLAVFWPALHQSPFEQLGNAAQSAKSYKWDGLVLMDGQFWRASELPRSYVSNWFLRTVPEYLLLLSVVGLCVGGISLSRAVREQRELNSVQLLPAGLLAFGFLFPLGYILLKQPVLYDGLRHFLFVIPPVACLAALTLEWGLRRLNLRWQRIAQFTLAAMTLSVLWSMYRLHPYQYVYFNASSGGLESAFMRDETDYWGVSHKEAGEWLNSYVDSLSLGEERVFKVYQIYNEWMLEEALDPKRFELSRQPEGADFYVSITRFNLHAKYPQLPVLHVVEREGVPLCYVFGMTKDVLTADQAGE